jgi:hypothetical protein
LFFTSHPSEDELESGRTSSEADFASLVIVLLQNALIVKKLTTSPLMRFPQIFTIAIAVTLISLSITSTSYAQAHTKGRKVAPLLPH